MRSPKKGPVAEDGWPSTYEGFWDGPDGIADPGDDIRVSVTTSSGR